MAGVRLAAVTGALQLIGCACKPCQCERKDRDCIYTPTGHVISQDSVFRVLRRHWGTKKPRFMIDLGCSIGQGIGHNYSDQLNFVEYFHAPGTASWGVEANPFYAQSAAAKARHAPWGTFPGVSLRVFHNAVGMSDDDELTLQSADWRDCGIPGFAPWASPRKYINLCWGIHQLANKEGWPRATQMAGSPFTVSARTVDSIWRKEAKRRHIDFLKVDFDTATMSAVLMKSLQEITAERAFSVMSFELDHIAFPRGFESNHSKSNLPDLLHFFELQGYVAFAKVPCYSYIPGVTLKESGVAYLDPIRKSFGDRESRMVEVFCTNFHSPSDLMLFDRQQRVLLDAVISINSQLERLAPLCASFGGGAALVLALGLLSRRAHAPAAKHTSLDEAQCQYGAPATEE